ncbi:MAG: hypothetical protein Q8M96_21130, partial [Rubrivivax sp.]|nr:hypothetical protein [Rubrivivax sp.]
DAEAPLREARVPFEFEIGSGEIAPTLLSIAQARDCDGNCHRAADQQRQQMAGLSQARHGQKAVRGSESPKRQRLLWGARPTAEFGQEPTVAGGNCLASYADPGRDDQVPDLFGESVFGVPSSRRSVFGLIAGEPAPRETSTRSST